MKPRVDKKGKALHNTPLLSRGWFNPFLLVFFCFSDLRDGPLEKLWVGWGGEGNCQAAGIFFRYQIPCLNFFRP